MSETAELTQTIRNADNELRKLLALLARRGDYETMAQFLDVVRQFRRLTEQIKTGNEPAQETECGESGSVGKEMSASADVSTTSLPVAFQDPVGLADTSHRSTKRGRDYPCFYRGRDGLIKIGWSKKRKVEYCHKAPWEAVQAVVKAIQEKASSGEPFTLEELTPIRTTDGSEVPSYQTYLVLAWLRKENLIRQHGRQGYSLAASINLLQALDQRRMLLPAP